MPLWNALAETIRSFTPMLIVLTISVLIMTGLRWLLLRRHLALEHDRRLPRQLVLIGLGAAALVAVILALPVSSATREQLLTVLGLLLSGIFAISSTTLVSNAMAGLMLRSTRSFRTGDFIRIEKQFGRVTQRRLLHTEIQTEDRELTTLPNFYLITNPVTVVRSSGTLISVSLSLGYDVHHATVEPLLIAAAKQAELEEPFVWIRELGNYSITYRVSGFLADIKNLLSARSNLCRAVLDQLHDHDVEILSPTFMNQRPVPAEHRLIPAAPPPATDGEEKQKAPEDLMFDKAERAERLEGLRFRLEGEIEKLEDRIKTHKGDERAAAQEQLAHKKKKLAVLVEAAAAKKKPEKSTVD